MIVLLTDQQRWDITDVYGNRAGATFGFGRQARESGLVRHAITPRPGVRAGPSVSPDRPVPHGHGSVTQRSATPPRRTETRRLFDAAGCATGRIGKRHLAGRDGPDGPVPPERRGGHRSWLAPDRLEFTSDAHRAVVHDGDGEHVRLRGYRSDTLVRAVIRFVADHHDRPFLLFLSLLEPHHQNAADDYPAPRGYRERYEGRRIPPDLTALAPGAPHAGRTVIRAAG
ncbi:hypothetical protein ACFY9A_19380 [Streptomyces rubradiris]|uniref:hypothetical protein n=1 Tax=Streptomyces rubradiris TaxID=285531 RepID=UPI0036E9C1B3